MEGIDKDIVEVPMSLILLSDVQRFHGDRPLRGGTP